MEPGSGGVRREQQLLPALPAPQVQNQGVPAGLVDLVHPRPGTLAPHFFQHGSQKKRIKGHI